MKKILIVIGSILLLIPSVVKADIGAPELKTYQIIIINPEGTNAYNYNDEVVKKIPVNTICDVYYENLKKDKEVELNVDCKGLEDDRDIIYIKNSNDIKLYSSDHEFKYKEENDKAKFYAVGDIELYEDEYLLSNKSGLVIPTGTEFEAWETTSYLWYYYENGNTKGYFYINELASHQNPNILQVYNKKVMVIDGTTAFKENVGEEKITMNIPGYIELDCDYVAPYYAGYFNNRYKVEYNGQVGWFEASSIVEESIPPIKLLYEGKEGIQIYDEKMNNTVSNVKLKENALYEVKYLYIPTYIETYAYTNIDGKYYWIKVIEENTEEQYAKVSGTSYKITLNRDYNLYTGEVIKEGTELISYFNDYDEKKYFIKYNGFAGWLKFSKDDATIETIHETIEDPNASNNTIKNGISTNTNPSFYNLKTNVIIGIIAAVLISICGVITLVFINKKKKQNTAVQNNVVSEDQTTPVQTEQVNQVEETNEVPNTQVFNDSLTQQMPVTNDINAVINNTTNVENKEEN